MKLIAASLLTVFVALLGVQGACVLGWQVHDDCAASDRVPGHEESCDWDSCREGFYPPAPPQVFETRSKTMTTAILPPVRAAVPVAPRHDPALIVCGATTSRPAGAFPLLI